MEYDQNNKTMIPPFLSPRGATVSWFFDELFKRGHQVAFYLSCLLVMRILSAKTQKNIFAEILPPQGPALSGGFIILSFLAVKDRFLIRFSSFFRHLQTG